GLPELGVACQVSQFPYVKVCAPPQKLEGTITLLPVANCQLTAPEAGIAKKPPKTAIARQPFVRVSILFGPCCFVISYELPEANSRPCKNIIMNHVIV